MNNRIFHFWSIVIGSMFVKYISFSIYNSRDADSMYDKITKYFVEKFMPKFTIFYILIYELLFKNYENYFIVSSKEDTGSVIYNSNY